MRVLVNAKTLFKLTLLVVLALAVLAVYRWLQRPPLVEVSLARTESVARILALTGRVRPRLVNDVVPLVSGRLVRLHHEEGDRIQRGELLAEIDDRTARANLAQAQARQRLRDEEIEQERRALERARGLFEDGLIPRSDYEDAELAVERSEQALEQLREAVVEAETRLDDFVLRAPFDGYVLQRPIDHGQTVTPTTILYVIGTADAAFVEADVDERYLAELAIGAEASVLPLDGTREPLSARLVYIARQVDPRSGAALVRLQFEGPAPDLPAGLSLDVNVLVEEHTDAVTLPKTALGTAGRKNWVAQLIGGRVQRSPVTIIDWPAERVVALDGIAPGDVVLSTPRDVPEGTTVRVSSKPSGASALAFDGR